MTKTHLITDHKHLKGHDLLNCSLGYQIPLGQDEVGKLYMYRAFMDLDEAFNDGTYFQDYLHTEDFMLMTSFSNPRARVHSFKHRICRDYIFLVVHEDGSRDLVIPVTDEPFYRGMYTSDAMEPVLEACAP